MLERRYNALLRIDHVWYRTVARKFSIGGLCVFGGGLWVVWGAWHSKNWQKLNWFIVEIDRYIGRYLGFTDISVSAKTANIIGHNRSWQNAVIFLTLPDNLRKKAQRSKSRQLSYNNASRCGFINKQTRLTMERASAVTTETKASSGSFAMLQPTACRCCVRINSRCSSGSFRSTKSLTGT